MANDAAKTAIKKYLDKRAASDSTFAASYAKKNKSLDECMKFILGEARRRGTAVCMTDEEVFGLAVHYYDEDNITIRPVNAVARVAAPAAKPVNDNEIRQLKAEIQRHQEKVTERKLAKTRKQPDMTPSLFDLLEQEEEA